MGHELPLLPDDDVQQQHSVPKCLADTSGDSKLCYALHKGNHGLDIVALLAALYNS